MNSEETNQVYFQFPHAKTQRTPTKKEGSYEAEK